MELAPWEQEELEQWKGGQAEAPEAREASPPGLSGEVLRTHVNRSPAPSDTAPNYEPPRPTLPPQPLKTQAERNKSKSQDMGATLQKVRDNLLSIVLLVALAASCFVFYSSCSVFVIPPTDGRPGGATLITADMPGLNFVDSAEGFLTRHQGNATPSARAAMIENITKSAKIYVELPYFGWLHRLTTRSR